MKLEQYVSIEEKAEVFRGKHKIINSSEDFDKWFNGNHGKYFRGINEASFKNYTSAQRLFITHDLVIHGISVSDLVKQQVLSLRNVRSGLINDYYKSLLNQEPSDLLLLSFAQHQKKGIAPLLDFTLDRKIALFFMIDGCNFSECGNNSPEGKDKEPIENYSSLYYLTGRNKLAMDRVMEDNLKHDLDKLHKRYDDKVNEADDYVKYRARRDLRRHEFFLKTRFVNDLLSSDIKDVIIESPKEEKSEYRPIMPRIMISNINITAQQGCFVYHNDGLHPFENLYCVDIHKSLIPYIRIKYLTSQNGVNKKEHPIISRTSIYPSAGDIVEESIYDALASVVQNK